MPPDNALGWYETSLPQAERKQRGHFSTPPRLVEYILDACGYTPTADLSRIRVLDPACGSGNFLAGAARRLVTSLSPVRTDLSRPHPSYCPEPTLAQPAQTLQSVNQRKIFQHVQRNLWGFDPDPIACFLAEMQLRETVQRATGGLFPRKMDLHVHQADGLALPWEMGEEVDLFLANPPYLATKNSDLTGYRRAHAGGQIDSYLLFLEMALRIVRPGGWLGIVLPDPVLARANASRQRTRLLETVTIHHLWHLANVFHAQVGAVVLVAQKCTPTNTHAITWMREKWSRSVDGFKRNQLGTTSDHPQHEDGRAPSSTHDGEDGRAPSSMHDGEDGRPQGALPHIRPAPVPTIYGREQPRHIVGTGDVGREGGAPCGRPSPIDVDGVGGRPSPIDVDGVGGRPSSIDMNNGGRPSPIDMNDSVGGRPSSIDMNDGGCPSSQSDVYGSDGRPSSSIDMDGIGGYPFSQSDLDVSDGHPSPPACAWETTIPQSLFLQQPRAEFRYLLSSEHGVMVERLRSVWDASSTVKQNFAPLSTFLSIRRGEEMGRENSQLIPVPTSLSESHDKNSPHLLVLRGGVDIRPYATPTTQWCIAREAIVKSLTRYLAPKLLVVKSTHRLQTTLDIKGHVALQTLYLLHPLSEDASNDELYFFLALLNSRLLQEYVYILYTAYKWVQPQIEQHVLAQLPVPVIASACKSEIIERARHMVTACDKSSPGVEWSESIQCLYAEQERAIRMLYASALPGLFH